jgi:hypothetical protein
LPPRGVAKAELAAELAKTRAFAKIYANPLFRMAIPFTGVFPVGLIVLLISPLMLGNSGFMPARAHGVTYDGTLCLACAFLGRPGNGAQMAKDVRACPTLTMTKCLA